MNRLPYSIVDVFSTVPYKGNPLAVVANTTDSLTKTQMQLISRQFNLSEATFVCPPTKPSAIYRLRSFLPNGEEVFGAGHNSLGAWWYIINSQLLQREDISGSNVYHQELGDDVLPVEVSGSTQTQLNITMRQGGTQFLDKHPNKSTLANALGINPSDIGFEYDQKILSEPQVVTTSPARHLLVPVRDKQVLDRIDFSDSEALSRELAKTNSYNSGIYAFTLVNSEENILKLEARFMSPGMGNEDPATGSAAGPLAALVFKNDIIDHADGGKSEIQVVQGMKKGRRCVMDLTVHKDSGSDMVDIRISGTAVLVAEGNIAIPPVGVGF